MTASSWRRLGLWQLLLLHNCRRLGRCFSGILRDGRCRSANDDCGNGCFSGSSCTNTILLLCIATGRLDTYNNRYFVNLSRMSFRVSFRFLSNRINNTRIRQHFFQYQNTRTQQQVFATWLGGLIANPQLMFQRVCNCYGLSPFITVQKALSLWGLLSDVI